MLILPTSIVYNSTASRWEVTFDVNGFSGFYVTSNIGTPLPVRLISFIATPAGEAVSLGWKVAEQKEIARYTVERSADGQSFSSVVTQKATGSKADYTAVDNSPYTGVSYYRLKMESVNGQAAYSTMQRIVMGAGQSYFQLSPLPATSSVTVTTNDSTLSGTTTVITNPEGRVVKTFELETGSQTLSLEGMKTGVYFLRLANGASYKLIKL